MRPALLAIGSLLPLISAVFYIISILRGQTRPQRMTRFLLLAVTGVATVSLWVAGDTSGVWLALASFVEALLIWVLSLKKGMGGRDRLDVACLILCMTGVLVWIETSEPMVGLAASILADLIACVPALRKTIRFPGTEPTLFYLLGTIAGVVVLLAGPYTLQAMAFPLYIAVIDFAFVLAIVWPRKSPQIVLDED